MKKTKINRTYCVYGLFEEEKIYPFYIGKTYVGSQRFYNHAAVHRPNKTLRYKKIKQLLSSGKNIFVDYYILTTNEELAYEIEKRFIKKYGRIDNKTGFLTNHTDGGEGTSNKPKYRHTQESKDKISKIHSGKVYGYETRQKISKANSKSLNYYTEQHIYLGTLNSSKEACNVLGISPSSLSKHLRGFLKTAKGINGIYILKNAT